MKQLYVLLGSNLGNSIEVLDTAVIHLENNIGPIIRKSAFYKTAAWGKTDQPDFINRAIMLHTQLDPQSVIREILSIETVLGRVRTEKYAARTIDIDILFYGAEIILEKDLIIPHPAIAERRFVLVPMAEIAPDLMHPVSKKKIEQLLDECDDLLAVEKL